MHPQPVHHSTTTRAPRSRRCVMLGIIPAAGVGSRIQPLAFSKELLPVGAWMDGGTERPRAICEYLVDRMILGGAEKICFVISPGKSDILSYFGAGVTLGGARAQFCYVVQGSAGGLCDAIFRARQVVANEPVLVGLPDTIWFPEHALRALPDDNPAFLLFPVDPPEFFEAVVTQAPLVGEIQVNQPRPPSNWIWGAFKIPAAIF